MKSHFPTSAARHGPSSSCTSHNLTFHSPRTHQSTDLCVLRWILPSRLQIKVQRRLGSTAARIQSPAISATSAKYQLIKNISK
ncbi:hypothetical protein VTJ04DRAFT_2947 [Mycothermus thermophilus]|uniref:uncharacterized protein n=1 Tax=Humicola insolens TaxID=85995 RepID=UPI0037444EC9